MRGDALDTRLSAATASTITHAARPENVNLVLIDGAVHKRNGRLTGADIRSLLEDADAAMARITAAAGL